MPVAYRDGEKKRKKQRNRQSKGRGNEGRDLNKSPHSQRDLLL